MKKGKQGKSKLFTIFGIGIVVLLITGFIMAVEGDVLTAEETQKSKNDTSSSSSQNVKKYIEDFVEKKGIDSSEINNVTEIDFNSLPKEVSIENVNNANLAIYQIDYNQGSSNEKIFLVTYAVEKLESQGDLIVSQDKREFLNFGFDGGMIGSGFLKTSVGITGSLEKGYVMMRDGSITGISTSLEILEGAGELNIVIYKNGNPIQFGNSFVVDSIGVKKDYDIQSKDTVVFQAGDVISLYVQSADGISWKDDVSLVEITS